MTNEVNPLAVRTPQRNPLAAEVSGDRPKRSAPSFGPGPPAGRADAADRDVVRPVAACGRGERVISAAVGAVDVSAERTSLLLGE